MESKPIPEPPSLPILGHARLINPDLPLETFVQLADQYGEIFRLRFPGGRSPIFLCSHELVDEVCDEKRFMKIPEGALAELRTFVHDGLFTSFLEEENWGIAHRVLTPAFGPLSIRNMFDDMHDIASQLAIKWARQGPETPLFVTDEFTRLAFDTLALCSMDYRFNSFYSPEIHPFIQAMGDVLTESGERARRPKNMLADLYYRSANQKFDADMALMRKTANDVLKGRQGQANQKKDLLGAMLNGVDSKTGKKMTDQSIVDNLITFLIAGHETTSGLLSFTMYQLIKHPEAYRKAQQEVDKVIGEGQITVDHMSKLPYISAILREVLRLNAPISAISVNPKTETMLANKYLVKPSDPLILLLKKSHLDPAVYGEDADQFKPERMLDEPFNALPRNAWKPFGNGQRACIGRPFAWQEAVLMLAMLLQNFNFVLDDSAYSLELKQTLTIKPKDLYIRAILRDGLTATQLEHRLNGTTPSQSASKPGSILTKDNASPVEPGSKGKPLTVLYGSNSGTCEALAQRIASDAAQHGFRAVTVDCMDSANANLPKDQPVAIFTASYEGQPPDNAGLFVNWVESLKPDALKGVSYTVFGCGHHDWAQTFHRIPKLVDEKLEEAGAERLAPIGLADAAAGDVFTDFETWEDNVFWPALSKRFGASANAAEAAPGSGISVEIESPRSNTLRQDVMEAVVVETRTLTADGEPPKKHIEIKLPSGKSYRAGDYLAVLPINPKETVARAMRRFELPWDAHLKISTDERTPLPTGTTAASDVLGAYVELSQPATKKNILTLTEATSSEKVKAELQQLAGEQYAAEVVGKRTSVLDLLERYPEIHLPLASFLAMLPPMRVRQYSISSSPLWNPGHVTLTLALLNSPSRSRPGASHIGVASSYLGSLAAGDKLHVAVRPSHAAFHLPADPDATPLIMVGAGTGLAPFRGFVQERAAMIAAGRKVAPALLFYGCREPGRDDLYADELAAWERLGAVTVHRAYSRKPEAAEGGCKYVQDGLMHESKEAVRLWDAGARLYVCGSRAVGQAVADAAIRMYRAEAEAHGKPKSEEEAQTWWEDLRNARYATDVFD